MLLRVVKISSNPSQELIKSLKKKVLPREIKEIEKFRKTIDQFRSLIGKLLVKDGLKKLTGIPMEALKIQRDVNRRPYIENTGGLDFNISHSGNYVAVIISEKRVGIDIQEISEEKGKFLQNIFSIKEKEYLSKFSGKIALNEKFRIWVLKESILKTSGTGFKNPPEPFTTIPGSVVPGFSYKFYDFISGYTMAASSIGKDSLFPVGFQIEDSQVFTKSLCCKS